MAVVLGEVVLVVSNVPPLKALYHRMVLPLTPGVAVMVPVPQMEVLEAVGAAGTALMVSVTACRGVLSQIVVVL